MMVTDRRIKIGVFALIIMVGVFAAGYFYYFSQQKPATVSQDVTAVVPDEAATFEEIAAAMAVAMENDTSSTGDVYTTQREEMAGVLEGKDITQDEFDDLTSQMSGSIRDHQN